MTASFPEYCLLPRDPLNETYVLSFDVVSEHGKGMASAIEFFEEYGFVVVRDIFDHKQCEDTREAMWRIIETANQGFVRDDVSTWDIMKASGKYGLSTRGPCFNAALVHNRQNPLLASVLAAVVGTAVRDIVVSHDRFTIYRATALLALPGEEGHGQADGSKYATGERNVHLDLNPWWWLESSPDILTGIESLTYEDPQDFIRENNMVVECMGRHVQCVLNFNDNREEDGGTVIVPRFHRHVRRWCESHAHLRKKLPFLTFNKIGHGSSSSSRSSNSSSSSSSSGSSSTGSCSSCANKGSRSDCSASHTAIGEDQWHRGGDRGVTNSSSGATGESSLGASDITAGVAATVLGDTSPHDGHKKMKFKKKGQGGDKGNKGSSRAACIDNEAPLLALAHRVPMRQGSVLIWDQTMFHGSSPNSSSTCRMAQFLKAFPRSKAFPGTASTTVYGLSDPIAEEEKGEVEEREGREEKQDLQGSEAEGGEAKCLPTTTSPSLPSSSPQQISPAAATVVDRSITAAIHPDRLVRRATALMRELELAGSLQCVSPLGRSLFCLDALS